MAQSSRTTLMVSVLLLAIAGIALSYWRPWARTTADGDPTPQPTAARPWFVDDTETAGVRFTQVNGVTGRHRYLESVGGGVGVFDYDGDGWLDIYLVNGNRFEGAPDPRAINVLYRNNRDGTFTDVTAAAGVGDPGHGQGCCAADFDDDGDQDLYVTNFGPDRFYRNNGDGTFTEASAELGVVNTAFGQTCAFLDFDGDGHLDLYVQNYVTYPLGKEAPRTDYSAPHDFAGAADRLFRNLGNGTFRDVTERSGIGKASGKGMGAVCADLDDDGDIDLFVANDGMENFCFLNQGDGTFQEHGIASGLAYDLGGNSESSMGADYGDFDGDGQLDIVCPALRAEACTMYARRGKVFEDVSRASGVAKFTRTLTGFSPNLIDVDNDGDLDLFVCNGGVATNLGVDRAALYLERYGVRDILLVNDSTGRFLSLGKAAGPHFDRRLIGRGSAHGDIDNDGDIDLVLNNLAGQAVVLRNVAPQGHWITLKFRRSGRNRDGIHTRIQLTAGGKTQTQVVRATGSYLSVHDRRPHFGLGTAERIDRIEIRWPDGKTQVLTDVAVDQFLEIEPQ